VEGGWGCCPSALSGLLACCMHARGGPNAASRTGPASLLPTRSGCLVAPPGTLGSAQPQLPAPVHTLTLCVARHRCERGGGKLNLHQAGAICKRRLRCRLRLPHRLVVVGGEGLRGGKAAAGKGGGWVPRKR
jgi:hypothetical protein